MAELVYAYGSEPYAAGLVGSNPTESTDEFTLSSDRVPYRMIWQVSP